jgi:hypothetical protein
MVIPIVRASVIQRPGVIDMAKKTGIKKYKREKSKII